MLSAGLRLVLAVAVPLIGALIVHEARNNRRLGVAVAGASILVCAALTATIVPGVSGGGEVERNLGNAIAGVDLTARADSASVAVIFIACVAALVAVLRHRGGAERLAGLLLCLGGTVSVAAAGNLVLVAGGVEVVAAGTLLIRGQRGPGSRSTAILACLLGAAGLALVAAAAQLVSAAGSSDLALVSPGAIGGALAIPWALGGAVLLLAPGLPGHGGGSPARDWAAIGALPSGYLVLLRLQESAGGQLPGNASVALAVIGGAIALTAASSVPRAVTLAAAGRAGIAVFTGVMVSLFGGPLAAGGMVLAGLFLAIEVALLASPSWDRHPSGWTAASTALAVLPGGLAFAVATVGVGMVAHRGVLGLPQLVVLSGVLAMAAVGVARALAIPLRTWRPVPLEAILAAAAGLAGGLVPGLALRFAAAPLAGEAPGINVDAGSLAVPGGGFAGGYVSVAAAVVLVAAAAAIVVAGESPIAEGVSQPRALSTPPVGRLLAIRHRTAPVVRRVARFASGLDAWLEAQPQVPLFVGAAALAVLLFR